MSSFNTALDRLVELLTADPALQSFALAKWQKRVTVKRVFKHRIQINSSDLPVINITRPGMSHGDRLSGGSDNANRIHLYIGFHQDDAETAQSELVEVEEKINDVLTANYRIKDALGTPLVKNVRPGESVNDEGVMHPDYFIVKEVEIEHYR